MCVPTDLLKKKLDMLHSPEREIKSVNLKKDVKYGLGEFCMCACTPLSHSLAYKMCE